MSMGLIRLKLRLSTGMDTGVEWLAAEGFGDDNPHDEEDLAIFITKNMPVTLRAYFDSFCS